MRGVISAQQIPKALFCSPQNEAERYRPGMYTQLTFLINRLYVMKFKFYICIVVEPKLGSIPLLGQVMDSVFKYCYEYLRLYVQGGKMFGQSF